MFEIRVITQDKMFEVSENKNRDIPRENATPAEAIYLYNFLKTRLDTESVQQRAVSASILDLCLKKKISLRIDQNKKVYVTILQNEEGLNDDEKQIYNILKDVSKKCEEFEISQLNVYARKHYNKYSTYESSIPRSIYYRKLG